jgi:uncharacterized protein YjbI with pentapeptide repeats
VYLTAVYLTGRVSHRLCLLGVYLTGVHLTSVYLTGVYLMGVHLIGVYLMGVHLTGVHLMGVHPSRSPTLQNGGRFVETWVAGYEVLR